MRNPNLFLLTTAFSILQFASTAAAPTAPLSELRSSLNSKSTESKATSSASANIFYQDWKDEARSRTIPVKLYIPKQGQGNFPVVIFSHGLGGSREAAEYLGNCWASKGYLGVFIQHAGSDSGVWQSQRGGGRAAFMEKMKAAANGKNWVDRADDVRFVLDELERKSNDPVLKGKMDLSKIAIAGHSFGAATALALAGQNGGIVQENPRFADKRIKAAIYLCPPVTGTGKTNPAAAYGSIKIPGLLLTGTEDNSPIGGTNAEDRRIPFDNIKAAHQYLVNFEGADHGVFGGRAFRPPSPTDKTIQAMIDEVTGKFLDATLKSDQSASLWLDSGAASKFLGKSAVFEKK